MRTNNKSPISTKNEALVIQNHANKPYQLKQLNFREIRQKLQSNALTLLEQWIPNGKLEGIEYVALNPTRLDKHVGSFRINISNGKWIDFATNDKGGDLISLYAYLNKITYFEAAKYLDNHTLHPKILKNVINSLPLAKAHKVAKVNSELALKIWNSCLPAANTPVAKYLRSRGYIGDIPTTIKFHPALFHNETNQRYPAMISAVSVHPDDKVVAIHRTYLREDGSDKAEIHNNKMMLGSVSAGVVRLSPHDKKLILAEGIETALSLYQATGLPTWATLSTSGMINVEVLPLEDTEEIIIAADNDEAGLKAANKLADRLLQAGYKVRIITPKEKGWDFNDVLVKKGKKNE